MFWSVFLNERQNMERLPYCKIEITIKQIKTVNPRGFDTPLFLSCWKGKVTMLSMLSSISSLDFLYQMIGAFFYVCTRTKEKEEFLIATHELAKYFPEFYWIYRADILWNICSVDIPESPNGFRPDKKAMNMTFSARRIEQRVSLYEGFCRYSEAVHMLNRDVI